MARYQVEIDWDADGFGAGDDITDYVKSIDWNIGIWDELDNVARVGEAALVLHNGDRRFSPRYTSGTYYGKLLPNKPVRIRVIDTGGTYTVFRGVTREFVPDTGQYGPREARITCADLMAILQDFGISLPLQTDQTADYLLKLICSGAFRTAYASGNITFSGAISDGDYVEVNGVRYTFKNTLASANQVKIGTTIEDSVDNLAAAINGGEGSGTRYYAGTTRPTGCVASPRMTYYREVQADSPVRYYRLGESAGTNADDVGTNGRDGTYVNTPTLGASGALSGDTDTAVTFDGSNDYVSIEPFDLQSKSFAFECWIKPNATTPPALQCPISFVGANDTKFILYDTGQLIFAITGGVSVDGAVGGITFGNWYHIAYTYDAAADESVLYVNGVEVASSSAGPVSEVKTTAVIGAGFPGFNHWKGEIDEVAMYLERLNAEDIARHYDARTITRGVNIYANARGAWGNAITLVKSGTNIAVSGATLSGGVDGPASLHSFESGLRTISIAGDGWNAEEVSALDAVTQVVKSEQGLAMFWAAKDGTLTFKNGDYIFRRPAATASLTLSSDHNALEGGVLNGRLFNRIVVTYTPRGTLSSGVIARAQNTIPVPGTWGRDRFNPADDLEVGLVTVKIPYIDVGTGQLAGALSLTLPLEAGTDYEVNDLEDGTGFDYTNSSVIQVSAAVNGSDIEVTFRNTALGTLYVRNLQVRGVGLVRYDKQQIILDDGDSQDLYGRQTMSLDLPLPVSNSQQVGQSLAEYLLSRYKDPANKLTSIGFDQQTRVGSVDLFNLGIGDVIVITDYQTGVTSEKYLITGIRAAMRAGNPAEANIQFGIRRLDDVTYWILGDSTYGVLGSTTRLAV